MLRGNLSTRPFYNDRVVSLVLGGVALLVLLLTVVNVTRLMSLSARRADVDARLSQTRRSASQVAADVASLRRDMDPVALASLSSSALEANALIDRRTFSWTTLLGLLEKQMPYDVRLVSITPRVDKTVLKVSMTIVARQLADVDAFQNALAETGAFYDVTPPETQFRDDGTYLARVDTSYLPVAAESAAAPDTPADGAPAAPAGTAPAPGTSETPGGGVAR